MATVNTTGTDIAALLGTSSSSKKGSTSGTAADTENRFLALLVAQMQNQDPLNPMDNSEITTQMAQISTVNGIEGLNTTMKTLAAGFSGLQSLQAAALVGRQVATEGNHLSLAGGAAVGAFSLANPVDSLTITISDASGALVQSINLGAQPAGAQTFGWDGSTAAGGTTADGQYTFKISATEAGKAVTVSPWQIGLVQGVQPDAAGLSISVLGQGNVPLADVKKIF